MRMRFWVLLGTSAVFLWSAFALPRPNAARQADSPASTSSGERESSDPASRLSLRLPAGTTESIPFDPPGEAASVRTLEGNWGSTRNVPTDAWAERLFRRLDRNGDGLLNVDEMPAALRAECDRWGADKNGLIGLDDFKAYFRFRVEQTQRVSLGLATGSVPGNSPGPDYASDNSLPVGKLSPETGGRDHPPGQYHSGGASSQGPGSREDASRLAQSDSPGVDGLPSLPGGQPPANALDPVQQPRRASRLLTAEQIETQFVVAALTGPARTGTPSGKAGGAAGAASRVSPRAPATPLAPSPARPAAQPPAPASLPDSLATVPLPINGSAYWNTREQQNEARLRLGHAPVLFLGDSITDGLAAGVGTPVWETFYAPLGMEDFAIAGLTTSQVLWQVRTGQVAALSPDVVVLMIGTNNLALGQSPAAVASGITEIVREIQAQSARTQVLLLGIFPRGRTPAEPLRQSIAQVNARIAALDDGDRVRYLDIGNNFLQPDGTISPLVMPDFLHPSEWGYLVYTASVWPPLVELLAEAAAADAPR